MDCLNYNDRESFKRCVCSVLTVLPEQLLDAELNWIWDQKKHLEGGSDGVILRKTSSTDDAGAFMSVYDVTDRNQNVLLSFAISRTGALIHFPSKTVAPRIKPTKRRRTLPGLICNKRVME